MAVANSGSYGMHSCTISLPEAGAAWRQTCVAMAGLQYRPLDAAYAVRELVIDMTELHDALGGTPNNPSACCATAFSKNSVEQSGESIESRLPVEMTAAWDNLNWHSQAEGYLLRPREWNIRIVVTRPASARFAFPIADAGPIERFSKERMIDSVVVGKT